MKRIVIAAAMGLCVVFLSAVSSADTLILRDGSRIEGTMVALTVRTITFLHADGVSRRYPTSEVEAVEFVSAERANPHATSSHSLDAPAGTLLVVRTVEVLDSRNSSADQTFAALIEAAVTNAAGGVIVPRNASAQLIIRQVSTGGRAGSPEMAVDIRSITVDGRRYLVSTTDLVQATETGFGKNRRLVQTGGASSVLGTVIDATEGGDAGGQVLTRGRDVHVPSGTVLTFRLDKPLALQAER